MNECILVVDDDPEIVRAIAILLEKEGYQVLKAYNGMEALEQAVNPALRLIVIDVMMPRLDGLCLLYTSSPPSTGCSRQPKSDETHPSAGVTVSPTPKAFRL